MVSQNCLFYWFDESFCVVTIDSFRKCIHSWPFEQGLKAFLCVYLEHLVNMSRLIIRFSRIVIAFLRYFTVRLTLQIFQPLYILQFHFVFCSIGITYACTWFLIAHNMIKSLLFKSALNFYEDLRQIDWLFSQNKTIVFCLTRFAFKAISSFNSCSTSVFPIIIWLFHFKNYSMDMEFPDQSAFRDCEYCVHFAGRGNHL